MVPSMTLTPTLKPDLNPNLKRHTYSTALVATEHLLSLNGQ
jgi:hypothetical protein